jgi:superoxide reductase
MDGMDRRGFVRVAGITLAACSLGAPALARTFEAEVDASLFEAINRVKDPEKMTGLELHHVPMITLPYKIKTGSPFMVEVSVGRELHVVSAAHRITEVTLLAGNEPVGSVVFSSLQAQPRVAFLVTADRPVTLVAQARCNLHGLWEGARDISPE